MRLSFNNVSFGSIPSRNYEQGQMGLVLVYVQ
jgi:hypothetical protein